MTEGGRALPPVASPLRHPPTDGAINARVESCGREGRRGTSSDADVSGQRPTAIVAHHGSRLQEQRAFEGEDGDGGQRPPGEA